MPAPDDARLRHMLDAARKVEAFSRGFDVAGLARDEMRPLAIIRLVEVIGEAARFVSQETRDRHLAVPWRAITGTRDRLIHGYDAVDLEILGRIVFQSVPDLIPRLESIVGGAATAAGANDGPTGSS
jgi:uncharacterized protein with HEPN domain